MQHDFHLLAGGGQVIDVAGKFFKYKSGLGPIRVRDNRGAFIDLLPGQGVRNSEYTSLIVQDISGAANSGVLLAGGFDFDDDRITGTVEVVDGGKNRTLANTAFSGVITWGQIAGNYSHVGIANPAGSGKNIYIKAYRLATTTADIVIGQILAGVLATDAGTFKSKLGGGANSVARNQYQVQATSLIATRQEQISTQVGITVQVVLQEPVLLPSGYVFVLQPYTVNNGISAAIEFVEESL